MSDILFSTLFLSIVLLGIHSYFGLEIIKRGIIFTDLAIGQMAAVGAAISIFFFHGDYLYPISLTFALAGGAVIAAMTRKNSNLEAFIGLMYAFGLSTVFIILSQSSHGMEEFQKLMASDIIFTPMKEIVKTAVLYLGLGVFIAIFYKRTTGLLKDMIFFLTFSVTVTSSVKLGGVLIVFALLVAPALIALTINKGNKLIVAWLIGIVVNIISIFFSYNYDLPTGYTLVFFHGLLALVVSAVLPGRKNDTCSEE